jgi:exonuclease VII small subunit
MHRGTLISLGILEALIACLLFGVGSFLPQSNEVNQSFERAAKVSRSAENQVQLMRQQIEEVREKDFPDAVRQLRSQTRSVSASLKGQTVDFRTILTIADTMAAVSKGVESWSQTLDPSKFLTASNELGAGADHLEKHVLPSLRTVSSLEQCAEQLKNDVNHLHELTQRRNPTDNRELFLTFLRCSANLELLGNSLDGPHFDAARKGLREMESSLDNAIGQVEVLSQAVYPALNANAIGSTPFEMRLVWPEGKHAVESLRKAHSVVASANRELDDIANLAPSILQTFREERRKLGSDWELVLQAFFDPNPHTESWLQTNQLDERLPKLSREISELLRATERLPVLATDLRTARSEIEQSLNGWPAFVDTLNRSTAALTGSRQKLDAVLAQREQYEHAVRTGQQLLESTEDIVQSYTTKFDVRLGEQEYSLGQMEHGLAEVNEALPAVAQSTNDSLRSIRWVAYLLGGLIGIHGLFLTAEGIRRRRPLAIPRGRESPAESTM